jgi:hypothetical protein
MIWVHPSFLHIFQCVEDPLSCCSSTRKYLCQTSHSGRLQFLGDSAHHPRWWIVILRDCISDDTAGLELVLNISLILDSDGWEKPDNDDFILASSLGPTHYRWGLHPAHSRVDPGALGKALFIRCLGPGLSSVGLSHLERRWRARVCTMRTHVYADVDGNIIKR